MVTPRNGAAVRMLMKSDHLQKIVHVERLGQDGAAHAADKIIYLGVATVAGHENEAVAEMRTHALDGAEKHIAGQRRHHHVAEDDLKIAGQHLVHPFDAIDHGDDFEAAFGKEVAHDFFEGRVILEEENFLDRFGIRILVKPNTRRHNIGDGIWINSRKRHNL